MCQAGQAKCDGTDRIKKYCLLRYEGERSVNMCDSATIRLGAKMQSSITMGTFSFIRQDRPLYSADFFSRILSPLSFGLFDSATEEMGLPHARAQKRSSKQGTDGADGYPTSCDRLDDMTMGDDRILASYANETAEENHWKEICSRLVEVSEESVSDVDLLALLLSHLGSVANSREVAGKLIARFSTFGSVVTARSAQIAGVAEVDPKLMEFFDLIRAAGTRLAREEISSRPVLDSWTKLIAYLRAAMAHQRIEQIRILFLDRCNVLIADEVQHKGTIDHTPVYPREVAKRALALDASAIIMVHNHPSNHPAPSKADVEMTRTIQDTLHRLGVILHDHIIVSRRGHSSFREMGLLPAKIG